MTQDNKELISKAPSGRVKRTPVSGRNRLTVQGKDPNYVYRIVNDEEGRIARFQEGGYELLEDEAVKVGDKRANQTSSEGTVKQLSVGGGKKAYVMRIRRDWYEEDQKAKQAQVDALEATTKKKALDGRYGTLTIGEAE
jgi:hypothetical protein